MPTLYHAPQSRSVRPRWVLEELGLAHDLVRIDLDRGDQKRPAFLAINPNGAVPAWVDGDFRLFESAAICQYLADAHPAAGLAPAAGTSDRGHYYQWVQFAMCTLEPPLLTIFLHTIRRPLADRIPQLVQEARPQLASALAVLDAALAGRDFLVAGRFGVADVMMGSTIAWAQMLGLLAGHRPATHAYLARLTSRPAYQRAVAD